MREEKLVLLCRGGPWCLAVAFVVAPIAWACADHAPQAMSAYSASAMDSTGIDTSGIPGDVDAGAAAGGDGADAGAPANGSFHAMTITLCARDPDDCKRAHGAGGSPFAGYCVAFGSGVGTIRTREQAMTDLYKELRDRIGWGTHLYAESQHLSVIADADVVVIEPHAARKDDDSEPLVGAAFDLMASVDNDGEITVDTMPALAAGRCKLSIGGRSVDGGMGHCVFEEPTRERYGR